MSDGKRGRGRPTLPERERRTKQIATLVTEKERDAIQKAADKAELSVSDWLRNAALAALKKELGKIQRKR